MVNRVILIGRLGDSPKNNNTGKGTAVSNFRLAVEDTWKNKKEGLQRNTEWVRCVAWGKLADTVANYLDKGDTIYVEGRLQTREWTDSKQVTRYVTEVHLKFMKMLITKGKLTSEDLPNMPADDIPF